MQGTLLIILLPSMPPSYSLDCICITNYHSFLQIISNMSTSHKTSVAMCLVCSNAIFCIPPFPTRVCEAKFSRSFLLKVQGKHILPKFLVTERARRGKTRLQLQQLSGVFSRLRRRRRQCPPQSDISAADTPSPGAARLGSRGRRH